MDSKGEIAKSVFGSPAVPLPSINLDPIETSDVHKYLEERLDRMRGECEAYLEWAVLEIAHWKDKCYELEIELISLNAFEQPGEQLTFKRRRR